MYHIKGHLNDLFSVRRPFNQQLCKDILLLRKIHKKFKGQLKKGQILYISSLKKSFAKLLHTESSNLRIDNCYKKVLYPS